MVKNCIWFMVISPSLGIRCNRLKKIKINKQIITHTHIYIYISHRPTWVFVKFIIYIYDIQTNPTFDYGTMAQTGPQFLHSSMGCIPSVGFGPCRTNTLVDQLLLGTAPLTSHTTDHKVHSNPSGNLKNTVQSSFLASDSKCPHISGFEFAEVVAPGFL